VRHLDGQRAGRVRGDDLGDLGVVGELVVVLRPGAAGGQPGALDRVGNGQGTNLPPPPDDPIRAVASPAQAQKATAVWLPARPRRTPSAR
jgi:hypothetical protein